MPAVQACPPPVGLLSARADGADDRPNAEADRPGNSSSGVKRKKMVESRAKEALLLIGGTLMLVTVLGVVFSVPELVSNVTYEYLLLAVGFVLILVGALIS